MAKKDTRPTKVMRFQLIYPDEKNELSYRELNEHLWGMQKQVREILNKTTNEAYLWDYRSRQHYEESGEYLSVQEETGYKSLDGYIYDQLKDQYADIAAGNLISTIRKAYQKYNSCKKDLWEGKVSLPSYKGDQPIIIRQDRFGKEPIQMEEGRYYVRPALFSDKYKAELGLSKKLCFELVLKGDKSKTTICQRLLSGEYGLGESQLLYKNKKWFLNLAYRYTPSQRELDPDKILGVDLGEVYALYASSKNGHGVLKIEGGEITKFARILEARKKELQKQATYCGEGRIGHGTKTRVKPVYKAEDKIANFRDTINHRYSRALIDFAVKNGYGSIQMEDLSGIKENLDHPKRLQHWTYYDLQAKIQAKAAAEGIQVRKLNPKDSSRRCSSCGYIDKANRPSQEEFHCKECGYSCNADYNASQNLSLPDMEKQIQAFYKQKAGAKPK